MLSNVIHTYRSERATFFNILVIIALLSFGHSARSQEEPGIGITEPGPGQEVRERQRQQRNLARSNDVEIMITNDGQRSTTSLQSVPPELRYTTITSARDINKLLGDLYPYFGFTGSESLRFLSSRERPERTEYTYLQYIGELRTNNTITFHVNNRSFYVTDIIGSVELDRGLPNSHSLSKNQAKDKTVSYIRGNDLVSAYNLNSDHKLDLIYRPFGEKSELGVWWEVQIELRQPIEFDNGDVYSHDIFYITPDGEVIPSWEFTTLYGFEIRD